VGDCGSREGIKFVEKKLAILRFAFVAIKVDVIILLELFGGSAGHDFFKKSSIFSCLPVSSFSHNAFLLSHPYNTLFPILPNALNQLASTLH
jgi:hypothetical protein